MSVLQGILHNFGVEWPLFISQLIVFLIVMFILKRFAFGPIIQVLEERRRKIAESMENADKIKKDLAAAQARQQAVLDDANAQAQKMVAEARTSADAVRARLEQEANAEAERIVARAREAGELETARMKADFQREAGRLVVLTAQKVSGKILTPDDQKRLAEDAARQAVA